MATEPGQLLMAWLPDVVPEAADGVEGQVDVAEEPRVDGGGAHLGERAAEAGRRRREDGVVDLDHRLLDGPRRGDDTVRTPYEFEVVPVVGDDRAAMEGEFRLVRGTRWRR